MAEPRALNGGPVKNGEALPPRGAARPLHSGSDEPVIGMKELVHSLVCLLI